MENLERERNERVQQKLNQFKEMYVDVPERLEFQLLTLFKLQDEFNNTPMEHTRKMMDLLKMIQDIQKYIDWQSLKPKIQIETKDKKVIRIACKDVLQMNDATDFLKSLLGEFTSYAPLNKDIVIAETETCVIYIERVYGSDDIRGKRHYSYLDLTSDKDIEVVLRKGVYRLKD